MSSSPTPAPASASPATKPCVDAFHAALENRVVALDRVRMSLAAHVFLGAMVDGGYYSIFKRGMKGIYQHCNEKHLHRYLAEFDFRYSHRVKLGFDDSDRTERAIRGAEGKRLTYRRTRIHPAQAANKRASRIAAQQRRAAFRAAGIRVYRAPEC